MIELIKQQFNSHMNNEEKINRVREFLQVLILKVMYDKNFLNKLGFEGGTALRILFNLRRFSEDLDFSLIDTKEWDFVRLVDKLKKELELRGFEVEDKAKVKDAVQSVFLKFVGLLKELQLSNFPGQKLSVKLEVDSNPPKGANTKTKIITKTYMLNLTHLDLSSMFAKKLHACFYRRYTKGRDLYDLIWYFGKNVVPNFLLLNNAIKQTQGEDLGLNEENFKKFLMQRIERVDFEKARKDVERFLEDKNELRLLNPEVIENAIDNQ